ncbi:MAG: hypothetical protein HC877_14250 [Thioploca sp.]|nr:hypothetical protein [Thioploca sp.]
MNKTFLILGGYGNAGRLIAELLLQETPIQLVLAGTTTSLGYLFINRCAGNR